jgi:hypothetical protein
LFIHILPPIFIKGFNHEYEEGGLKMTNIQSFYKALKMSWLHKLLEPSHIASVLSKLTLSPTHSENLSKTNND